MNIKLREFIMEIHKYEEHPWELKLPPIKRGGRRRGQRKGTKDWE